MGLSLLTGLLTPIGDTPYTYLIKTMMGNSPANAEPKLETTNKTSARKIPTVWHQGQARLSFWRLR